ncbi:hypothetical protein [Prescottella equi]|uniref:hypothetical protein n=1 Tax=Rhodococcus hoagii TaxID=43767 RepID=UPI00111C7506|nr:hypothetical protein [Prescottella equi]
MSAPRPNRIVEHYVTVSVIPLPLGWVNVWTLKDGSELAEPCPALLHQEHRETDHVWDITHPDGRPGIRSETYPEEPPYDTRTVFAVIEGDTLMPPDNYSGYERAEYRAPQEGSS